MTASKAPPPGGPLKDDVAGGRGPAARRQAGHPPKFYTKAQVAGMLGVSPRSVQRWIACGDLAAHRFGGTVRIAETDLRVFVASHRSD
jgi:excisionase family DNA binding protein